MKDPVIKLNQITKIHYTDEIETYALRDIDLEVYRDEYVSLTGPSGCGKSSLLSILGLLNEPTSGSYFLNGRNASTLSTTEKSNLRNQNIGFIFQNFNLIGDMSVIDNVKLPLNYRKRSGKDKKEAALDALDRVGMSHRKNHYPSQLSGGQQQRVAIARAIVGQPALLLADEPTGNLDSENGMAVMSLLKQLHDQGTTIFMVTHDPRYTSDTTRSIALLDGQISREAKAKVA